MPRSDGGDSTNIPSLHSIQIEHFYANSMTWKRWHQQCEGAFTILKIQGEKRLPLLFHYIGQKVFSKLCDYMDDVDLYKQK